MILITWTVWTVHVAGVSVKSGSCSIITGWSFSKGSGANIIFIGCFITFQLIISLIVAEVIVHAWLISTIF